MFLVFHALFAFSFPFPLLQAETFVHRRVVTPVHEAAELLSRQVATAVRQVTTSLRAFVYYLIIASVIFWLTLVVSCVVYALFYYLYVPKIAHEKPVYFIFESASFSFFEIFIFIPIELLFVLYLAVPSTRTTQLLWWTSLKGSLIGSFILGSTMTSRSSFNSQSQRRTWTWACS